MLRNSHCILDLAPRYMVVLRCSSPVCVVTIFEERLIFLSSLEWCHVTFCRWKKGILFAWKGREPLRFLKNILMVEFVRWSTWQIHLLGLMSLGSSTYPAVRVKNELGDSWSSVSFSNTGTQDWWLCSLCDDIVKSFCLKACVDGEYPVCLYSVTVNMCTVASTGAGSEGRGLEGALDITKGPGWMCGSFKAQQQPSAFVLSD